MSEDAVGRIVEEVTKDYGEGVAVGGCDYASQERVVLPVSPAIDSITSGGIEEGSWVGVTGPEKSGKTTLALSVAAVAQRPEYGSRPVFYSKVEGRMSMHHLKGIRGLDLSPKRFVIFQSVEGRILSGKDHLKILENVIKTVPRAVIIIDSISALPDDKEAEEGVGAESRGSGAKMFSQFLRTLGQTVPVQRTIVLGITHQISNTSGWGEAKVERVAVAWKYQCDYQLRTIGKQVWEAGGKTIGLKVKWLCKTSPLGPPGMQTESYVRFGVGIDALFELIELASAMRLIQAKGAWYTLTFLEKQKHARMLNGAPAPKVQGAEKVYALLNDRPEFADALRAEVNANLKGVQE
jgi:recombination protein RecA